MQRRIRVPDEEKPPPLHTKALDNLRHLGKLTDVCWMRGYRKRYSGCGRKMLEKPLRRYPDAWRGCRAKEGARRNRQLGGPKPASADKRHFPGFNRGCFNYERRY